MKSNKYSDMQKKTYAPGVYRKSVEAAMRGDNRNYDHFGPLNDMEDMHKYLFKGIPEEGLALDFGCGPGRAIVKYRDKFDRIDGIDISEANIDLAKKYTTWTGLEPSLYVNNGFDLSDAPSEVYDVVYSIQTMIHISVYDIRRNLFEEMYRVLKPGGWVCHQMGFGVGEVFTHSVVQYHDNMWDAPSTNGRHSVTVSDPNQVKKDLDEIGFNNFSYDLRDMSWNHPQWIYFRAQK